LAGYSSQGAYATAVGFKAGYIEQGSNAIAIGTGAGTSNQSTCSIAIGFEAALSSQNAYAMAFGYQAAFSNQGRAAIAIGSNAGRTDQGANAIAIGGEAGFRGQGSNAVAIGFMAGFNVQPPNSVVINGSGIPLPDSLTSNATFLAPIRKASTIMSTILQYNLTSAEVVWNSVDVLTLPQASNYGDYLFYDGFNWVTGYSTISLGDQAGGGAVRQGEAAVAVGAAAGYYAQEPGAIAIGPEGVAVANLPFEAIGVTTGRAVVCTVSSVCSVGATLSNPAAILFSVISVAVITIVPV
jgi:hypothetical protein